MVEGKWEASIMKGHIVIGTYERYGIVNTKLTCPKNSLLDLHKTSRGAWPYTEACGCTRCGTRGKPTWDSSSRIPFVFPLLSFSLSCALVSSLVSALASMEPLSMGCLSLFAFSLTLPSVFLSSFPLLSGRPSHPRSRHRATLGQTLGGVEPETRE